MGDIYDNERCNTLQCVQKYDTLDRYPQGYKGGRCDLDGRTVIDCRGGVKETAQSTVHRQALIAGRGTSRIQDTWRVASQVRRPGQVYRSAGVQTREQTLTIGKLTISLPAADRLTSPDWYPIEDNRCVSCCLLRIVPYDNGIRKGRLEGTAMQPQPIYCQWCYPDNVKATEQYGLIPL